MKRRYERTVLGGWVEVLPPETSEYLEEIERRTVRGEVDASATSGDCCVLGDNGEGHAHQGALRVLPRAVEGCGPAVHPGASGTGVGDAWHVVRSRGHGPADVPCRRHGRHWHHCVVEARHATCPHGMRFVPVNKRTQQVLQALDWHAPCAPCVLPPLVRRDVIRRRPAVGCTRR
jgi:hypothetical protein